MATTTLIRSHSNPGHGAIITPNTGTHYERQPSNEQSSFMRPRLMSSFSIRTFASHPRKKCNPTGLHVTKKGDFIVVDNNEKKAKRFSKMGQLLNEFGDARLKDPWDVTVLPDKAEIAISDPGDNTIKVFSKDGSFIKEFDGAKHLQEPYGITLANDSDILVADKGANCIYVHDKDGFVINSITAADSDKVLFDWAHYITTDSNGNIIVTEKNTKSIKALTYKGNTTFTFQGEENNSTSKMEPRGVAVDKHGNILVADGYNGCVTLLSSEGEYIQQLVTRKEGLGTPSAIIIDKDGQLVIADSESEEIKVFSYSE